MPRHERYPDEYDEEPDRISDEDVLRLLEETFQEKIVETDVPPSDIRQIRWFINKFNVLEAADATDEDIEIIWHRLARDPSINKDYPYIPAIFKDYAYTLTDYRTRLYRSQLPVPPRWVDFIHYSDALNTSGKERFSNRSWMIEKVVIPNLSALGLPHSEVTRHAYGDEEGRIRAAEFTRFLGWLSGQSFMRRLPAKLEAYKTEYDVKVPSLTNIAQMAIIEVMDTRDNLSKEAGRYERRYPLEPRASEHYQDMMMAMDGIYHLCDSLLLGEPKQK